MTTRAKFACVSVTQRVGWSGVPFHWAAEFQVVTGDTSENKEFFASTPSGRIEIATIRSDHFKVGKQYFVDFTEAE